jgi:hypothetical protein
VWHFFRGSECEQDPSNWFAPTTVAVAQAFESAGFALRLLTNTGRATFRGHVKRGVPEFLRIGSGEGYFYDVLVRNLFGQARHGLGSVREQTLSGVLASPAYFTRCGGNPGAWLARLWDDLLGRPPSAAEHEDALGRLVDNTPQRRQAVALGVLAGPEYRTRWVVDLYRRHLGRAVTEVEQNYALSTWRMHGDDENLLVIVLGGDEYFRQAGGTNSRWLDRMYRVLFDRERDVGSEGFLADLDKGVSRGCITLGLLDSAEYRQRLLAVSWQAHVGKSVPAPANWTEALHAAAAARGVAA